MASEGGTLADSIGREKESFLVSLWGIDCGNYFLPTLIVSHRWHNLASRWFAYATERRAQVARDIANHEPICL